MELQSVVWLGLLVVLLLVELATMGLTTIWFAGGALAAFAVSMFTEAVSLQVLVFLAVSSILLIFTRPFAVKFVNKNRVKTNADSLIGKIGIVTAEIDNLESRGEVQVSGQIWSARSKEGKEKLEKGTQVKILDISGVKLIVEAV